MLGQRDMVGGLGLVWWHFPRAWPLVSGFCVWKPTPGPLRAWVGVGRLPATPEPGPNADFLLGAGARSRPCPGPPEAVVTVLAPRPLRACLALGEGASLDRPLSPLGLPHGGFRPQLMPSLACRVLPAQGRRCPAWTPGPEACVDPRTRSLRGHLEQTLWLLVSVFFL